jgi:hypothetical protein
MRHGFFCLKKPMKEVDDKSVKEEKRREEKRKSSPVMGGLLEMPGLAVCSCYVLILLIPHYWLNLTNFLLSFLEVLTKFLHELRD